MICRKHSWLSKDECREVHRRTEKHGQKELNYRVLHRLKLQDLFGIIASRRPRAVVLRHAHGGHDKHPLRAFQLHYIVGVVA